MVELRLFWEAQYADGWLPAQVGREEKAKDTNASYHWCEVMRDDKCMNGKETACGVATST